MATIHYLRFPKISLVVSGVAPDRLADPREVVFHIISEGALVHGSIQ